MTNLIARLLSRRQSKGIADWLAQRQALEAKQHRLAEHQRRQAELGDGAPLIERPAS